MRMFLAISVATPLAVFMLYSASSGLAYSHFDPFTDQQSPLYGQDRKEFQAKWRQKCEQSGHKQDSESFRSCMARHEDRLRNTFRPRGLGW